MKIILILLLIVTPIFCEELKTSEDFIPQPIEEEALDTVFFDKIDNSAGLITISAVTAIGMGLTLFNSYDLMEKRVTDPDSRGFQRDIVAISASLILTSISSWLLFRILEE